MIPLRMPLAEMTFILIESKKKLATTWFCFKCVFSFAQFQTEAYVNCELFSFPGGKSNIIGLTIQSIGSNKNRDCCCDLNKSNS